MLLRIAKGSEDRQATPKSVPVFLLMVVNLSSGPPRPPAGMFSAVVDLASVSTLIDIQNHLQVFAKQPLFLTNYLIVFSTIVEWKSNEIPGFYLRRTPSVVT